MKFDFIETRYGVDITITPESVEETAKLLRFCRNAKKEAPQIFFSFSSDAIVCYMNMQKVKPPRQVNSISNK